MKQEVCGVCGKLKTKLVQAGVSKRTGKPYDAFYACATCKSSDKPKVSSLEERLITKFNEIDARLDSLEKAKYNLKGVGTPNDEVDESGLPF